MTTEELVKISKDYFVTVAVDGLKAAAVTALPFLASPVPMYFLDAFLDWLIAKIADIMEQKAFFAYTDFRVSKQGKEYVEAKLKGYAAELKGVKEEIESAQENIKKAFRNFAPFNT